MINTSSKIFNRTSFPQGVLCNIYVVYSHLMVVGIWQNYFYLIAVPIVEMKPFIPYILCITGSPCVYI